MYAFKKQNLNYKASLGKHNPSIIHCIIFGSTIVNHTLTNLRFSGQTGGWKPRASQCNFKGLQTLQALLLLLAPHTHKEKMKWKISYTDATMWTTRWPVLQPVPLLIFSVSGSDHTHTAGTCHRSEVWCHSDPTLVHQMKLMFYIYIYIKQLTLGSTINTIPLSCLCLWVWAKKSSISSLISICISSPSVPSPADSVVSPSLATSAFDCPSSDDCEKDAPLPAISAFFSAILIRFLAALRLRRAFLLRMVLLDVGFLNTRASDWLWGFCVRLAASRWSIIFLYCCETVLYTCICFWHHMDTNW